MLLKMEDEGYTGLHETNLQIFRSNQQVSFDHEEIIHHGSAKTDTKQYLLPGKNEVSSFDPGSSKKPEVREARGFL